MLIYRAFFDSIVLKNVSGVKKKEVHKKIKANVLDKNKTDDIIEANVRLNKVHSVTIEL